MRILITGITGFAGSHLADYVLKNHPSWEIFGINRWRSPLENIKHILDRIVLFECDLKDLSSVEQVIEVVKPNYISHLAANSYVISSWKMPNETITNNVNGQINLFEAVKKSKICEKLGTRIQLACSSEEYGLVEANEVPIKETNPLRPLSTYGVSKVAQDYLGYQYYKSYGMHIIRTRAFNHTGPRRGEVFVCSNFAKQLAEQEMYQSKFKIIPTISVGNLNAIRDFTDVRDIVRGYWLALEKGEPGEVYNVGSGRGISMESVLHTLIELMGCAVKIKINKDKFRPSDVPRLICDYSKFKEQTGWKPKIPFGQTMKDLLEYWRDRVYKEEGI